MFRDFEQVFLQLGGIANGLQKTYHRIGQQVQQY